MTTTGQPLTIVALSSNPAVNTLLTIALVGLGVLIPVVVMVRKNSNYREERRDHWFGGFAAQNAGIFHSGQEDGTKETFPTFGVTHPEVTALSTARLTPWVEFFFRDRQVIGVDDVDATSKKISEHTYYTDQHYVQVQVPASPSFYLVAEPRQFTAHALQRTKQIKTFDKEFDAKFTVRSSDYDLAGEILEDAGFRQKLLRNPQLSTRPFAVEGGSIRTWGEGHLTRSSLMTEANFLIDLAEILPEKLWLEATEP